VIKLALVFSLVMGLALPAHANQILNLTGSCAASEDVHRYLTQEYEEVPFSQGPSVIRLPSGEYAGGIARIYVNPQTRGFTVVTEFVEEGVTCILLMGDDFRPIRQGEGA
jgi:hypothetical protein